MLRDGVLPVFFGLMFGMALAALNVTLIAPALPLIAADLGGVASYSWLVLSNVLASTVVVPIVGKLSDLHGRRPFYLGGIATFAAGSALAGVTSSFEFLVFARVVQGIGMGAMIPLSQAIIGDLFPPRDRGKYQGIMGGAFGIASIVGPLLGGIITHSLNWRWLFLVNIPFAALAFFVVYRYMRLPVVPVAGRDHSIDGLGIVTLTAGLAILLLATQMGGNRYQWDSLQIIGAYAAGAVTMLLFVWIERRAAEPILPMHLWRDRVFTLSNLSTLGIGMAMYGAIFFVPAFLQGVIGLDAAQVGTHMLPLLLGMILGSIAAGQLISITGLYRLQTLAGLLATGVSFWMLTRIGTDTTSGVVLCNLGLLGAGLGFAAPTYLVIVQSVANPADMGIATAANQLFRSIGGTIGVAVMGTAMTQGLTADLQHLPNAALGGSPRLSAAAALDPEVILQLTPDQLLFVRAGLADVLNVVFTTGLPFVALAFVATLLISESPLRTAEHISRGE